MLDIIEKTGNGSVIQHGKHNDRIYLMKLKTDNVQSTLDEIYKVAKENDYSKLFCKVPKSAAPLFLSRGYTIEAFIPKFYKNKEDLFFLSKFLNPERLKNIEKEKFINLNNLLADFSKVKSTNTRPSGYKVRKLDENDSERISEIYSGVFESYPFPIQNREYIVKTMDENVQYFGAEKDGELAALASSEIDFEGENAEMTDFATRKSHTGKNLSVLLLNTMEKNMRQQGITTLYTIARLNSTPMNKTFLRSGYDYSGTLIKNTNISGKIESMNVYYKHL